MKILVTGATGTVGRHVVKCLLKANAHVRALTRRPENADLPAGVEVVGGDLERPAELAPLFAGMDRLYLVVSGETEWVVTLAKEAGVQRIVVLSSAAAAFDGDSGGDHHRAAEVAVENSGLEWTHVRPGMFAGNLLDWADAIRAEGVVKAPYDQARQSPVHEVDVAEVAAAALLSDGHDKRIYTLSGPAAITKSEQVAALSAGIGVPIGFDELTPQAWREHAEAEGTPSYVVDWLLGWWARTMVRPEAVHTDVAHVLGRPAKPLVEWARDHAAEFR